MDDSPLAALVKIANALSSPKCNLIPYVPI